MPSEPIELCEGWDQCAVTVHLYFNAKSHDKNIIAWTHYREFKE